MTLSESIHPSETFILSPVLNRFVVSFFENSSGTPFDLFKEVREREEFQGASV
jgi:hypothetical protein